MRAFFFSLATGVVETIVAMRLPCSSEFSSSSLLGVGGVSEPLDPLRCMDIGGTILSRAPRLVALGEFLLNVRILTEGLDTQIATHNLIPFDDCSLLFSSFAILAGDGMKPSSQPSFTSLPIHQSLLYFSKLDETSLAIAFIPYISAVPLMCKNSFALNDTAEP